MNPPRDPHPRHVRYSLRHHARLDAETHAKLEELAAPFHRKRAQVLRHVMQWGIDHGKDWTIDPSVPASVHPIHVLLEPELLQQVEAAAAGHGVRMAAWLRQAMCQVRVEDFPASWRAGEIAGRSHDSQYYSTRFMLRLDDQTLAKLEHLASHFDRPHAEIIRALIAQATLEAFPLSWHLAVEQQR